MVTVNAMVQSVNLHECCTVLHFKPEGALQKVTKVKINSYFTNFHMGRKQYISSCSSVELKVEPE